MKKLLMTLFCAAFVGCVTPHNYTDSVDPSQVTRAELEQHALQLEEDYQKYHQAEGVIFQAYRSDVALEEPDFYGNGGDSCIFTGHKLAADVYRYRVTKETEDIDRVLQSLRGLYILTHATGTPGVLCRAAFPLNRSEEWKYPEAWAYRDPAFVAEGPAGIADPFNPGSDFPQMVYYTRATKDQLTGLLFGLAVTWEYLESQNAVDDNRVMFALAIAADITEKVYNHLRAYDFNIVDQKGENDTTADDVDGLLRLQLLAVYRETVTITSPHRAARINEKYQDLFPCAFYTLSDSVHVFNNWDAYFAWNLRHLRAYSVFILEDNEEHKELIRGWADDRLWQYISGHLNTKFIYIQNAIAPGRGRLAEALFALKSLKLKPIWGFDSPLAGDERKPNLWHALTNDTDRFVLPPHLRKSTSYSIWQKEPWDVGSEGHDGTSRATGLDFILAYWMGRFYGF